MSSDAAWDIIQMDLTSQDDNQKELHDAKDENEEVQSCFTFKNVKSSWQATHMAKLRGTYEDGKLCAEADKRFHHLTQVNYRQRIKATALTQEAIEKGFEICYPHNLITTIIKNIQYKYGDELGEKLSSHVLNILIGYFRNSERDRINNDCIGNIPALENWTTELREHTLDLKVPFFFSWDLSRAIKLVRSVDTPVTFEVETEQKHTDIIRIRKKLPDGTYKYYQKGDKQISKFKIFKNIDKQDDKLEKPELWGHYNIVNEGEKIFHHRLMEDIPEEVREPDHMYILDWVEFSEKNAKKLGDHVDIKIDEKLPCLALFWNAQNKTSLEYKNPSNYTTNSENVYQGWDPIKKFSIKHGSETYRFKDTDSDIAKRQASLKFPSSPITNGYFAHSLTYDINRTDINIGKNLSSYGTLLQIELGNKSPYKELENIHQNSEEQESNLDKMDDEYEEDVREDREDQFYVKAAALIVKKLKWEYTTATDKDGKEYKYYNKCRVVKNFLDA